MDVLVQATAMLPDGKDLVHEGFRIFEALTGPFILAEDETFEDHLARSIRALNYARYLPFLDANTAKELVAELSAAGIDC